MLPIHHDAPLLRTIAAKNTAKAAGLKICFLFNAITYFEAIATTPINVSTSMFSNKAIGPTIKVRINAVMKGDSRFVFALKIFANV